MAETDKDDLINIIEENGSFEKLPTTLPLMPVRLGDVKMCMIPCNTV